MANENEEGNTEKTAEELAEQAAIDAKAGAGEGEVTEKTPVKPETKSDESVLAKAVNELKEALRPGMTQEQQEAAIKRVEEETGFDRKKLGFLTGAIRKTSMESNLPLYQEIGRGRAEKALGDTAESLIPEVEKEMAKLPIESQANPDAWRDMAYLVLGRSKGGTPKPKAKSNTTVEGGMKPGLSEPGRSGGAGAGGGKGGGSSKQYNDDEKTMIRVYFGGDAAAYEKSKGEKRVGLGRQDNPSSMNVADKELARLTGGNVG